MDIRELLSTNREERLATHCKNIRSVFASTSSDKKAAFNRKILASKALGLQQLKIESKNCTACHSDLEENCSTGVQTSPFTTSTSMKGQDKSPSPRSAVKQANASLTRIVDEAGSLRLSAQKTGQPQAFSSGFEQRSLEARQRHPPHHKIEAEYFLDDAADRPEALGPDPAHEWLRLSSSRGKVVPFKVFKEDAFLNPGDGKLLATLISDVTYDEDQSSDDCIVADGMKKAKSFLLKNMKAMASQLKQRSKT